MNNEGLTLDKLDEMMKKMQNEICDRPDFIPYQQWQCETCNKWWQSFLKKTICLECAMKLDDRLHSWNGVPIYISEDIKDE